MKFKYNCNFCKKEIRMNTKDIVKFIQNSIYDRQDIDDIVSFFDYPNYNLCGECARQEGFEIAMDFEGWEE